MTFEPRFADRSKELNEGISSIEEIIADLADGKMCILVDEPHRENEGDLLIAADFVTPEAINFMARYGRGLVCLTLTPEKCSDLELPLMSESNKSPHHTNFTVSIEAATGVSTGISAADRARTIQVAVRAGSTPKDIVQPGHIFPLRANPGGVLARAGHTEAGCDLARLAGRSPAAVICEILNNDGSMARLPDLKKFSKEHGLRIGTIADLIQYRSRNESLIVRQWERIVSTAHGDFALVAYSDRVSQSTHLAMVRGDVRSGAPVLVRVHEPTSLLDILDVTSHGHSWGVHDALARISKEDRGVLVLLGCQMETASLAPTGAASKAIDLHASASSTLRDYGLGAQILRDLGVKKMRILALERKMPNMTGYDLEVVEFVHPRVDTYDRGIHTLSYL